MYLTGTLSKSSFRFNKRNLVLCSLQKGFFVFFIVLLSCINRELVVVLYRLRCWQVYNKSSKYIIEIVSRLPSVLVGILRNQLGPVLLDLPPRMIFVAEDECCSEKKNTSSFTIRQYNRT
jgi:hypothetical protein